MIILTPSPTHKAQGLTCNNVIAIVDSTRKNLTNQKNFYVEISRAKERAIIITDDKTKSINQIKKETGFDLSAKEHQNLKDQHHQIINQHHQPNQPQIKHQPQPTHQSKGMDFSR